MGACACVYFFVFFCVCVCVGLTSVPATIGFPRSHTTSLESFTILYSQFNLDRAWRGEEVEGREWQRGDMWGKGGEEESDECSDSNNLIHLSAPLSTGCNVMVKRSARR